MDRPHLAFAFGFPVWHVDSYENFLGVFVPARDSCLAMTSNRCLWPSSVGKDVRVLLTGLFQVHRFGDGGDVCVVDFDEGGIEAPKHGGV